MKSITTPTGTVEWNNILTLNDVQNTIGLSAGNKLSNKHVNFQQQKMKVSLAVQTLSNSVAVGLQSAFELGVDGLDACSSTVQFIQYFDKLFDVMNSRSKFVPGMKQAISSNNIGYRTHFFQEVKQYLLSLRTLDGQSLLECRR
ncbi:hypothetical protein SNE40_002852 [Patella caerulea]|uniref:Transposable element P transposase-like GTP-binding insertion domain-containing protein n=1 Tax=Patella caerulea TaxID=87958 RepID=A0AAN8K1V4_PATCE